MKDFFPESLGQKRGCRLHIGTHYTRRIRYTWSPKLAGVLQNLVLNKFMSPNLTLFHCFIAFECLFVLGFFFFHSGKFSYPCRQVLSQNKLLLRTLLLKVRVLLTALFQQETLLPLQFKQPSLSCPFFKSVFANYSLPQKIGKNNILSIHFQES